MKFSQKDGKRKGKKNCRWRTYAATGDFIYFSWVTQDIVATKILVRLVESFFGSSNNSNKVFVAVGIRSRSKKAQSSNRHASKDKCVKMDRSSRGGWKNKIVQLGEQLLLRKLGLRHQRWQQNQASGSVFWEEEHFHGGANHSKCSWRNPVDFSQTAERGAKTFLKWKFIKNIFTTKNFGALTWKFPRADTSHESSCNWVIQSKSIGLASPCGLKNRFWVPGRCGALPTRAQI